MIKEIAEPSKLTLRDMLSMNRIIGDVEIINECNETLVTLAYVEDNVCPLERVLAVELLDRPIVSFGTRDNRMLFKVAGVDDAE